MDGLVAPALVGCALLLYHSCKPEKYQPAELLAKDTNFLLMSHSTLSILVQRECNSAAEWSVLSLIVEKNQLEANLVIWNEKYSSNFERRNG